MFFCLPFFFQIEDILSEDEEGLKVDITDIYGGFSRMIMAKMDDIFRVNISGCDNLNPSEFTEAILGCLKMERLDMVGCTQFTEYNIVDICTSLPNLVHFDARQCSGLQYANANIILCNLRQLKIFKVEMKYPEYERKDWCKLKMTFPDVHFGEDIEEFLQYGKHAAN